MLLSANAGMYVVDFEEKQDVARRIVNTVDFLSDLGFEAIDVDFCQTICDDERHDPILDDADPSPYLDLWVEKCKEKNMKVTATHLPYEYDYLDTADEKFEKNHAMTVKALVASEHIGAPWAVMHATTVEGTVEYVKRLFAESGVQNIGIAIENPFNISIEVLKEAYDILKAQGYRVGLCLDIGHTNVRLNFTYNIPEVIKQLGSRIKVLHIHDNSHNSDCHFAPYSGYAPWEEIMQALKEIDFKGEFNYEVNVSRTPARARRKYVEYCREIGRHLISLFDDHVVSLQ